MIRRLARAGFRALCAFLEEALPGPVDTDAQALEVATRFHHDLDLAAEQREYHAIRCEEVAEAAAERHGEELADFQAWEIEYVRRGADR